MIHLRVVDETEPTFELNEDNTNKREFLDA